MKMTRKPEKGGFTLVELLVVIVIIAALAALSFTVGPKMLKKAKATEAMQNLRQLGPLLSTIATDHEMKLPAILGPVTQPDGSTQDLQWNELCLATLYPDTKPADFKTTQWWDKKKVFLRNPMFLETAKPRGWTPLNPGYAFNEMIAENLAAAKGAVPSHPELMAISVPLAALGDPGRTPLIAPCDNYFYRYDAGEISGFKSGTLKDLMTDGKIPVLFVDGHVEVMTPDDYLTRKLSEIPIVQVP
jgi:prepilin-type N-terminal cleavage/methylation domain-containing protein/prepilin-type processing-associated H-X9-DG protein